MEHAAAPETVSLIDSYCAAQGITLKVFQDRAGISRTALYRVRTGDPEVSTDVFDKCEEASGGQIRAEKLYAEWRSRRRTAPAEGATTT